MDCCFKSLCGVALMGVVNVPDELPGVTHSAAVSRHDRGHDTPPTMLGNVAAFVASDRASAMTGTVANLTGGLIAD